MGLFDLSTDRNLLYWNRPMNADKLYTSLSPNTIMAKLTNHTGQTYITPSPDKHYSRDSIQVLETSVNNIFLRTNLTRTISKSYELFLGLNNTTCCLFFFYTGIWYTILKAVTKISVVVNVRNITRVTDLCHLIIVTLQETL